MRYSSLFLFTVTVFAQFGGHAVVRGEVQMEGVAPGQEYQVEMSDCSGGPVARAWLSSGNRFEFDEVTPGCKMVRVVSVDDKAVLQETQIFAEGAGVPLIIRVPKQERERGRGGVVSVERLRHPVPEKAVRVLADANRLWQAGRAEEAGDKLRPAVARYPDVWEIRLNLGIVEMKLEHFDAAAEQFLKARELQPRSETAAVGAGFALMRLKRMEDAERAAKDAVAIEPGNQTARILLERIQRGR